MDCVSFSERIGTGRRASVFPGADVYRRGGGHRYRSKAGCDGTLYAGVICMAEDRFVYSAILFFVNLSTIINRQSTGEFSLHKGPDLPAVNFLSGVFRHFIPDLF